MSTINLFNFLSVFVETALFFLKLGISISTEVKCNLTIALDKMKFHTHPAVGVEFFFWVYVIRIRFQKFFFFWREFKYSIYIHIVYSATKNLISFST